MILTRSGPAGLTKGKTILDATEREHGIAYAMIGAALGYGVAVCLPKNASVERKRMLRVFGATIVETSPLEATDGAQRKAKQMAADEPDRSVSISDQYNNDANWRAHSETTAPEIWAQTEGRITHFVAGLGTSGTFVGTTRRLKELNPNIAAISMQPDTPLARVRRDEAHADGAGAGDLRYDLGGRRGDGRHRGCPRDDPGARAQARAAGRRERRRQRRVPRCASRRRFRPGRSCVTVLCDAGTRYLADGFWEAAR